MFEPTLIEVPVRRPLREYRRIGMPILDQETEGACTGFGLATVVHCLLRTRKVVPDRASIGSRIAGRGAAVAGIDRQSIDSRMNLAEEPL